MIKAEFTTSWREWQSDGVPDSKLGDLEQVSEAEKAGAKTLTAAALNALNLDGEHYDRELLVSVEVDGLSASLTVSAAVEEAVPVVAPEPAPEAVPVPEAVAAPEATPEAPPETA